MHYCDIDGAYRKYLQIALLLARWPLVLHERIRRQRDLWARKVTARERGVWLRG